MLQVQEYREKVEALKREIADAKTRLPRLSAPAEIQETKASIEVGEAILPVLEQMKRFLERLQA